MLSPKLDLAYFRSLKPLTRRDGLVPLGICVGLAVVFWPRMASANGLGNTEPSLGRRALGSVGVFSAPALEFFLHV